MGSYAIGIDIYNIVHKFEITGYYNIWCDNIKLKSLRVYDDDNKIKGLYCYYNYLTELKIIGGKNIKTIRCFNNKLTRLDLSMCTKLDDINCDVELEKGLILPKHKLKILYE